MRSMPCGTYLHPLPAKGGTPPINRGRAPSGLISHMVVVLCTLASLLRNNLRRVLPHYGADVEGDDEEDDERSKNDAEEEGHDGGDTFLVAEVLQELIEEDACGDCNDACYSDKPQVEATEKQSNVPSFGAVNLA